MRKVLIATAAVVLACAQAHAGSYGQSTTCARYGGSVSCRTEGYFAGGGRHFYRKPAIIQLDTSRMSDQELADREIRIHQWEVFCRPVMAIDSLGVSRYVYAHEGCEFGRSR